MSKRSDPDPVRAAFKAIANRAPDAYFDGTAPHQRHELSKALLSHALPHTFSASMHKYQAEGLVIEFTLEASYPVDQLCQFTILEPVKTRRAYPDLADQITPGDTFGVAFRFLDTTGACLGVETALLPTPESPAGEDTTPGQMLTVYPTEMPYERVPSLDTVARFLRSLAQDAPVSIVGSSLEFVDVMFRRMIPALYETSFAHTRKTGGLCIFIVNKRAMQRGVETADILQIGNSNYGDTYEQVKKYVVPGISFSASMCLKDSKGKYCLAGDFLLPNLAWTPAEAQRWFQRWSINDPLPEPPLNRCFMCGKQGNLSRCSSCREATYCSKECQRADWKRHKVECHL
jgi:MYND finger